MKEYKRLTQSYRGAPLHTDMEVTDGDEIYERLAELEDKIENGELVEIPPLISYNEHLKKYEVLNYSIEIYVKEYCKTKSEAEKKLKELQNER